MFVRTVFRHLANRVGAASLRVMKSPSKIAAFVPALALSIALPLSPGLAQNEDADPIEVVEESDPVMNAAIAQAQATLPEWLAVLESPPAGYQHIVFKFPLDGWEHIWVENVRRDGDVLSGTLSNNPYNDKYALGDAVRVYLSDVSDWAYYDDRGIAHGHRTTAALFGQMDAETVASFKSSLGWDQ